ncbi:MAG: DUF5683 domain-containing protein [Sphingobacteriales bacterium]|nr:DUF5683 domain-containing protein [Sphingobacteriales bacterium]
MQKFLLLILVNSFILGTFAQSKDSTSVVKLPVAKSELTRPQKATLLSLIPGGGQIYNQKYWKVPVVYIGFGALAYSTLMNQQYYDEVRLAYLQRINKEPVTNPEYANVPTEMLFGLREYYRKNRDLSVIGLFGLYAFNLIDAAVDAHLREFDVTDKLSLQLKPVYQMGFAGNYSGLKYLILIYENRIIRLR